MPVAPVPVAPVPVAPVLVAPVPDGYAVTKAKGLPWMDLTAYGLAVYKVRKGDLVVIGSIDRYEHELTQLGFTRLGEHFRAALIIGDNDVLRLERWKQAFPRMQIIEVEIRDTIIEPVKLQQLIEANRDSYDVTTQRDLSPTALEPPVSPAKSTRLAEMLSNAKPKSGFERFPKSGLFKRFEATLTPDELSTPPPTLQERLREKTAKDEAEAQERAEAEQDNHSGPRM